MTQTTTVVTAERFEGALSYADYLASIAVNRDQFQHYYDVAREIVARYGGTIEKFIGDAVMGVWGTPSAHEDDAERAVRAALELVAAVPRLDASGVLQARAGVLTGEAAVAIGLEGQGMIAGIMISVAIGGLVIWKIVNIKVD